LPDNEFILGKWAQRFQVSARDAFGLIANVGEDCAGAVQFVPPERLAELRAQRGPAVEWLDCPHVWR
jgi:serine/threonine-protein kinase HipA